jgi:hypothetical protein
MIYPLQKNSSFYGLEFKGLFVYFSIDIFGKKSFLVVYKSEFSFVL